MASAIPVFGPNSVNKQWVDQISKTLQTQLAVTIDTPPLSIFEVPIPLKAEKIEAYVPQHTGLGPNNHFQPELYQKMEQKKLISVKRVLKPHQIHDIQQVVKKIKDIVPAMRTCYESYLDADDDTLAWLFTIDGLFLLDQLECYSNNQISIAAKDFIKLENQIPLMVLKEIQTVLNGKSDNGKEYLESKFQLFCESHSPFHLSTEKINLSRVHHPLDYMYQFIVQNDTSVHGKISFANPEIETRVTETDPKLQILEAVIKIGRLIPVAQPFLQIVEFVTEKFPKKTNEKETQMAQEIKVPTVSQLRHTAGVKFQLAPRDGGIRNIKFVLEKERSVYLPRLYLNIDSEIILRNLVAYEQLMAINSFNGGYGLELTEYVDFMCGIIDTSKDVKLLRDEKIIVGNIRDEEIVRLFNGISRSRGKMSGSESELTKTVEQLNKVYESTPVGWVQRLAEKQLPKSAKFLTLVVTILSILITAREVYSRAFGPNPPLMKLVVFVRSKLPRLPL